MYVEQFWKCFEETGNVTMYLSLKEYEKLYFEHTDSANIDSKENLVMKDVDRMK